MRVVEVIVPSIWPVSSRFAILFAALLGLSACEAVVVERGLPVAELPPQADIDAQRQAQKSDELREYYQDVERRLVAQGLLRTGGGGPDAPYSERDLVSNFIRIALFEEYSTVNGQIVARQTESHVHRWDEPVRMDVHFGPDIPLSQQLQDRRSIGEYANRLARVSKHPIRLSRVDPNFHIFVVNEAARQNLRPEIEAILPGISDAAIRAVTEMDRATFCLVFAWDPTGTGKYSQAVAVIRGEHPELLRQSCIHEEIAQGLGLSNDSPSARPSIFNDDEEFGLLTDHDEMLIRMLYDPRITPGMSPEVAREVATVIASELLGNSLTN